jgi:radical SAM protein with 4Fe4S-binding SPASM domain
MARFRARSTELRVPLSGTLELTRRCNLKCVHCYLGPQEEQRERRGEELDTEAMLRLVDEIADAGCLYLLITGGDPMVRADFADIYAHARKRGMVVTVFCDGVLVDDRITETFRRYPPRRVEVSLYGATRETYEAITRIEGSYDKCLRGIQQLLDAGAHLQLKTVLMKPNEQEVDEMRQMAADWGVRFRIDAAIFPCLSSGSHEPLDLRVSPQVAVDEELQDPEMREAWLDYYERRKGVEPIETLYRCGAGMTGFYLSPFGELSPCLMTTNYSYDLKGSSFRERWEKDVPELRERRAPADYACNSCEIRGLCSACPAFFRLETGDEAERSAYVCSSTAARRDALLPENDNTRTHPALPVVRSQSPHNGGDSRGSTVDDTGKRRRATQ